MPKNSLNISNLYTLISPLIIFVGVGGLDLKLNVLGHLSILALSAVTAGSICSPLSIHNCLNLSAYSFHSSTGTAVSNIQYACIPFPLSTTTGGGSFCDCINSPKALTASSWVLNSLVSPTSKSTKKDLKDLAFFLLCPSKLAIPINTWLSCFLSSTLSTSSSIESTKICRIRCPSPAGNTATQ